MDISSKRVNEVIDTIVDFFDSNAGKKFSKSISGFLYSLVTRCCKIDDFQLNDVKDVFENIVQIYGSKISDALCTSFYGFCKGQNAIEEIDESTIKSFLLFEGSEVGNELKVKNSITADSLSNKRNNFDEFMQSNKNVSVSFEKQNINDIKK